MTRKLVLSSVAVLLLAGCQSTMYDGDQELVKAQKRIKKGPPPPGYIKIIGGVVPNWKPEHMFGQGLGPAAPVTWQHIGPRPITGEYWSGSDDASGRTVSIAPHPTNPDIVYIASASGGIWKTIDGGVNWMPLTDELSNLNHGAVALDPNNPDIVYAGTGEYTSGSQGDGIFRSVDGGTSWERIATTAETGSRCSRIVVDPQDPQIIHFTGTSYAHSLDGGESWQKTISFSCSSLAVNPIDPAIVFVGRHYVGVFRSTDYGNNFSQLVNGLPTSGFQRVILAMSESNPERLYAAFANGGDVIGTYRSDDGGDSWFELANTPNFAAPQAWYDMYVAVDPTDEDTVYAGGVSPIYANAGIIKSTNGGQSWTEISLGSNGVQTHPDHHWMSFGPDGTLWEGNDGGVWKSLDGGDTWINCNADLALTQHYTVGFNPQDDAQMLGGTQDNGSIERIVDDLSWPQVIGGDGGFLAYNFDNPGIKYTTYVYLSVQRWINGQFSNITGPWGNDPKNFIAPLVMDPNDAHTLLGGTNRVWRTENADGAANWTAISTSVVGAGGTLNTLAVAEGDSDIIYTGSSTGSVYVTFNAVVWNNRSAGLTGGQISDIVLDPQDAGVAYVSYHNSSGARVFRTENFGVNWTNVTGDLPTAVGGNALAADWRFDPPHLYLGSGAGVYTSSDGGATWLKDGLDLPNVNIGDLQIDPDRDTIIAGTYGRGAWRANLPAVVELVPADSFNAVRGFQVGGDLSDVQQSDDSYLKFNPGITLNQSEPPVWIEFEGTLPNDNPSTISVTLESSVNTVGLNQTIEVFNWSAGQYQEVDSQTASFNNDTVVSVDLSANVTEYVESGTGHVKTRTGWRATGPVFVFPWTVCIDQVVWTVSQ